MKDCRKCAMGSCVTYRDPDTWTPVYKVITCLYNAQIVDHPLLRALFCPQYCSFKLFWTIEKVKQHEKL